MVSTKQVIALFSVRLKLYLNNIRSKAGLGKIIGMSLAALIMVLATASAASDTLDSIYKLPFANIIAEWGIGFLALYAIFVVFTGDLVSGHTLNTGQMSSDFHYLATLPISPTVLILTKLFERLITDYFGILFLLPALIGVACYRAYTVNSFLVAILLFFEISITIGLLINLANIFLMRFFKKSTRNNFYSIFGYISAILTLIPFLLLSNFNPAHVPIILEKIADIQDRAEWLIVPIRWLAVPLLKSTPFCIEFLKITILWFILSAILTILFHIAVKNNWFTYAHSSKSVSKSIFSKKLFSGIFWKEWLMLKSDLNLLINALLMPISVIAIEIYFLKQVFSFTSMSSVMNFIWGSIVYFSLFGPINIIGYEGKAISLLESMPISPSEILKKKYYFWVLVALIIFVPSTIITFKVLSFDWLVTTEATVLTIIFTLASVWSTVCCSAIFAKYDTLVLQQHSTFLGKMAAMFLMSLLLPIKNASWLNFYSLLVFVSLTSLCYIKAQNSIAFRQDKDFLNSETNLVINSLLLILSFVAMENNIRQLFYSIVPDVNTGIWSWALSIAAMFFFFIIFRRKSTPILPKITTKNFVKTISSSLISLIFSYCYFLLNPNSLLNIKEDISQIIDFFSIIRVMKPLWTIIVFFILVVFMISVIRRIEENLFGKASHLVFNILGILLAILISTQNLYIPVAIFMLMLLFFKDKENNHALFFYSSVVYYSILFTYIIM